MKKRKKKIRDSKWNTGAVDLFAAYFQDTETNIGAGQNNIWGVKDSLLVDYYWQPDFKFV